MNKHSVGDKAPVANSLWARIVLAQLTVALLLALTLPLVVDLTIHGIGDDLTGRFLGSVAQHTLTQLSAGRTGAPLREQPGGAVAIFLIDATHTVQLSGPRIDDIVARPVPEARHPVFAHGPQSDFYVVPTGQSGQWLVVAENRGHPAVLLDDVIAHFLHRFAIIVPLALLLSALGTLIAVRLTMRPIRRAAAEAASIDAMNPSIRLEDRHIPAEIIPLVQAANLALDKIDRAYERERRFTATVVHELRTALSTISLRAETLPPSEVRNAVEEAVGRAARVIEQMLELATLDGGGAGRGTVRLDLVAGEVVAEMGHVVMAAGRKLVFTTVGGEATSCSVRASEAVVAVALRNLIDNANRHSYAGGSIEIVCDNGAGRITVADEGPGIRVRQNADGRHIFTRTDGIRSGSSGLGLAIVTRAVEAAGGAIEFGHSRWGGAAISLHFPPHPCAGTGVSVVSKGLHRMAMRWCLR